MLQKAWNGQKWPKFKHFYQFFAIFDNEGPSYLFSSLISAAELDKKAEDPWWAHPEDLEDL